MGETEAEPASFFDSLEMVEGAVKTPYLMTIYGIAGSGKSNLAKYAEDPFFIPMEDGALGISGAKKFPKIAENIDQVFDMVKWVVRNKAAKTIVFDSLGAFQDMAYIQTIKENPTTGSSDNPKIVKCIQDYDYHGGYGLAMKHWNRLFSTVRILHKKGINVIFICHSQLKNEKSVTGESFKKIGMNVQNPNNGDAQGLIQRESHHVLFMEVSEQTEKLGTGNRARLVPKAGRPDIMVHVRPNNAFFAKVREKEAGSLPSFFMINSRDQSTYDQSSKALMDAVINAAV